MPKLTRIKTNETLEEKALRMGVYLVVIGDEPCFTCLIPNTELLSLMNGYKDIENIQLRADVISHKGLSTKILERMERPYDGEVITITGVGMESKTLTIDHEVYVKEGRNKGKVWKKAGDLSSENYLIVPKIKIKGKPHCLIIDSEIIGWFVAEGYTDGNFEKCRSVVFTQMNVNKREILIDLLKSHGFDVKEYDKDIEIHNRELSKWLRYYFYDECGNKKLPTWFLQLPQEEIVKFLRGYWLGDGYFSKNGAGCSSNSEKLTKQIAFLLMRLEIFPRLSYEEEDKEYNNYKWTSKMHKIRLSGKHTILLSEIINISHERRLSHKKLDVGETKKFFYVPIKDLQRGRYKGIVKNIKTESETFTLPFIVHNCGHKKRLVYPEKTDGRTIIINKCLFCSVKHPTAANRSGP